MQSRFKFHPGDVFEIKTPVGLGFFQYTHECAGMGELVRVLPGLYKSRPEHLSELVHQQELYYVHVTLEAACQEGIVCRVGHEKLPKSATSFPIMRKPGMPNAEGRIPVWFIGNGAKMSTIDDMRRLKKVAVLTADQRRLSIKVLWPPNVMVERIAWGWTPERDDEYRKAATAEFSDVESGSPRMVEHFLYFPQESNAHKVAQELRGRKWTVSISEAPDNKWLVLGRCRISESDDIESIRAELERLAGDFGGEYDGWGMLLGDGSPRMIM